MTLRFMCRLLAIACLLSSSGCGTFGARQEVSAVTGPEAMLEAKVKKALISATDVDGAAIGIGIEARRVTLTGFAASEAERRRAEQITEQVEGVGEVINQIEVREDGQ